MSQTKIYALFAAVNEYQKITNLGGCVNDANNISNYIEQAAKAQKRKLKALKLYDEKATKANITTQLIEHLGQATKDDICLFYFSGHGGQENVSSVFKKHEPDLKLEVLACVDSNFDNQGSFLADKELRFLIHQLYDKTKAQIITIFDCCHSGTNTRAVENETLVKRQIDARLMDGAPARNWSGFIFNKEISPEKLSRTNTLSAIIPEGKHLQLAACENKQSAYEVGGKGIFTSNLVSTLKQTKGNISYRDLISALKLKIRGSFEQTPQIYATGDEQLLFHSFLGGITDHQLLKAKVVYNKSMGYWMLNMGALHGINRENSNLKIEIVIEENGQKLNAKASAILPDFTMLRIDNSHFLDMDNTYTATLSGLVLKTINIHLSGADNTVFFLKEYLDALSMENPVIELVDAPVLADYKVIGEPTSLRLYSALDKEIVKEITGEINANAKLLYQYLSQIAKWNFVRDLDNPYSNIDPDFPLDIQIFSLDDQGGERALAIENDIVKTPLTFLPPKTSNQHPHGKMRISIKNNSDKSYYCALMYLSQDFGIMTDFLKGNTMELLPDHEVWAWEGDHIPFQQEHYIKQANWPEETAYLKLIISTETFDITQLTMDSLPHPSVQSTRGIKGRGDWRNPDLPDWTSRLITVKVENPYFVPAVVAIT